MEPTLQKLTEHEWPAVYRLMKQRAFPQVPQRYGLAKAHFAQAALFGLMNTEGLQAGFVFGPPQDGIAFFDVVCQPRQAGKWASRALLRQLFAQAFEPQPRGFGLRALWVQPHGAVALKAALAGGFQLVTPVPSRAKEPPAVLVATPTSVPKQFYQSMERNPDGQPV